MVRLAGPFVRRAGLSFCVALRFVWHEGAHPGGWHGWWDVEGGFARVATPSCDAAIGRRVTRNSFCVTAIPECVAQSAVAASRFAKFVTRFADCMTQSPVLVTRQSD